MARLNLSLPDSVKATMEATRERAGVATMAELVRKALVLYDLALTHHESGGWVVLQKIDDWGRVEQKVVVLP